MALENLRLQQLARGRRQLLRLLLLIVLLLLLSAGQGHAKSAYSQNELLIWMQRSNFGYQVLQQAQNSTTIEDVDGRCVAEVRLLLQAADARALPALKVLDAWGKFPHGLFYGHFSDMGNYDSCLSSTLITSKYCLTSIHFESLLPQAMGTLSLQIGACLPASCRAEVLQRLLDEYLQQLFGHEEASQAVLLQESDCSLDQREPLSGLDWFAIVLLVILVLLIVLSTILDYTAAPNPLWTCFSLRQNLRQLMRTTGSTAASGAAHIIPCLNGIRCLTIIWIIYGHDYMYMLLAPNVNTLEIVAWAQKPFSMILQSGTTSVDTFFLISGMLLVMATLRELDRSKGKLNVPLMYLHRIVRLTPVLAMAVLLFMTLFPRMDSGPLWQKFSGASQLCSDTWWATLLYVQNYAAAGRMCLGHSWYLAVDMQLFILSPLLVWPLWRWRRRAVGVIVVLLALLFGCVFSIIMINEFQVFNRNGNLGGDSPEMRMIYYTTHARATPWLVGLLFGCFLHSERGRRRRLSWWLVLLLWLLALTLLCLVIWIVYPYTQHGSGVISPLAGAFYLCCSRIAWPLALCWIIWACQTGKGGVINALLSSSFWEPISKVSYCLYIWHLVVETVTIGRIRTSQHFSNYDAILRFWSDFGVTICVSVFMYLSVEAPFVRLEMQLLRNFRQQRKGTIMGNDVVSSTPTPNVSLAVIATPSSVSQQNLVEA